MPFLLNTNDHRGVQRRTRPALKCQPAVPLGYLAYGVPRAREPTSADHALIFRGAGFQRARNQLSIRGKIQADCFICVPARPHLSFACWVGSPTGPREARPDGGLRRNPPPSLERRMTRSLSLGRATAAGRPDGSLRPGPAANRPTAGGNWGQAREAIDRGASTRDVSCALR